MTDGERSPSSSIITSSSTDFLLSGRKSATTSVLLQHRLTLQTSTWVSSSCSTLLSTCSVTNISSCTSWLCSGPPVQLETRARQRTTLLELHDEEELDECVCLLTVWVRLEACGGGTGAFLWLCAGFSHRSYCCLGLW